MEQDEREPFWQLEGQAVARAQAERSQVFGSGGQFRTKLAISERAGRRIVFGEEAQGRAVGLLLDVRFEGREDAHQG